MDTTMIVGKRVAHNKAAKKRKNAIHPFVPQVVLERFSSMTDPRSLDEPIVEVYNAAVGIFDASGYSKLSDTMERNARLKRDGKRYNTAVEGFSRLSGSLESHGMDMLSRGPENLTKHLNQFLRLCVDVTRKYGPKIDIIKFVGDAVVVQSRGVGDVYDNSEYQNLIVWMTSCAKELSKEVSKQVEDEELRLTMHVGIGASRVMGCHVGGLGRWEYFIAGDAIRQMGVSLDDAEDGHVVMSQEAQKLLFPDNDTGVKLDVEGQSLSSGSFLVSHAPSLRFPRSNPSIPTGAEHSKALTAVLSNYIPQCVSSSLSLGGNIMFKSDLRDLAVIFVKLLDVPDPCDFLTDDHFRPVDFLSNVNEAMQLIQKQLIKHGAQLRQFVMDDKGTVAIIAVGLPPMSHPDNSRRALRIALALMNSPREMSIGVTTGTSYCGIVGNRHRAEYAMVGDAVVLSARLMCAAQPGQVLCDQATRNDISAACQFVYTDLEPIHVKGKEDWTKVYGVNREIWFSPAPSGRVPSRTMLSAISGHVGESEDDSSCPESVSSVDRFGNDLTLFDQTYLSVGLGSAARSLVGCARQQGAMLDVLRAYLKSRGGGEALQVVVRAIGSPEVAQRPPEASESDSSSARSVTVALTGLPGTGKSSLLRVFGAAAVKGGARVLTVLGGGDADAVSPFSRWAPFFAGGLPQKLKHAAPVPSTEQDHLQTRLSAAEVMSALTDLKIDSDLFPVFNEVIPELFPPTPRSSALTRDERAGVVADIMLHLVMACLKEVPTVILLDDTPMYKPHDWLIVERLCEFAPALVCVALTTPVVDIGATAPPPTEPTGVRSEAVPSVSVDDSIGSSATAALHPLARAHLPVTDNKFHQLTLHHLHKRDLYELLRSQFEGTAGVDPPLVDMLWTKFRGNPAQTLLLADKLCRDGSVQLLPEDGRLCVVQDLNQVNAKVDDDLLKGALAAVDRLSPSHRMCIKVCSVIGQASTIDETYMLFAYQVQKENPGIPCSRVAVTVLLQQLCASGILSKEKDTFVFTQTHVRSVVYSTTPHSERSSLHRRLAYWLSTHYRSGALDEHHAVIGHHYLMAESFRLALRHLLKGAAISMEHGTQFEVKFILEMCEEALKNLRTQISENEGGSGGKGLSEEDALEMRQFEGRISMLLGQLALGAQEWQSSVQLLRKAVTTFTGMLQHDPVTGVTMANAAGKVSLPSLFKSLSSRNVNEGSGSDDSKGGAKDTPGGRSLLARETVVKPAAVPQTTRRRGSLTQLLRACLPPSSRRSSEAGDRSSVMRQSSNASSTGKPSSPPIRRTNSVANRFPVARVPPEVDIAVSETRAWNRRYGMYLPNGASKLVKRSLLSSPTIRRLQSNLGAAREKMREEESSLGPTRSVAELPDVSDEMGELFRVARLCRHICSIQLHSVESLGDMIALQSGKLQSVTALSLTDLADMWSLGGGAGGDDRLNSFDCPSVCSPCSPMSSLDDLSPQPPVNVLVRKLLVNSIPDSNPRGSRKKVIRGVSSQTGVLSFDGSRYGTYKTRRNRASHPPPTAPSSLPLSFGLSGAAGASVVDVAGDGGDVGVVTDSAVATVPSHSVSVSPVPPRSPPTAHSDPAHVLKTAPMPDAQSRLSNISTTSQPFFPRTLRRAPSAISYLETEARQTRADEKQRRWSINSETAIDSSLIDSITNLSHHHDRDNAGSSLGVPSAAQTFRLTPLARAHSTNGDSVSGSVTGPPELGRHRGIFSAIIEQHADGAGSISGITSRSVRGSAVRGGLGDLSPTRSLGRGKGFAVLLNSVVDRRVALGSPCESSFQRATSSVR